MNLANESEVNTPQTDETAAQDEKLLLYFRAFLGFICTILGFMLLFFDSPLSTLTISPYGMPAMVAFLFCVTAFICVIRAFARFIATKSGFVVNRCLSLFGICLAPLLLPTPFWPVAVPITALGAVALCFGWCINLCAFSHIMLNWLTAITFALAACLAGLVWSLNLDTWPLTITICILFIISWLLGGFERNRLGDSLLQITPEESKKRASTAGIDRWTYSIIGIDFGFALGLLIERFQQSSEPLSVAVFSVAVPIVIAGVVLIFFRYKLEYTLERYSKDFLSFTIALCVLPLAVVPSEYQAVFLMILLLVSILQIIIVINAFLEFIRFEELSPAWYFGEGAFESGGVCLGFFAAWLGLFGSGSQSILPLSCYIVVLLNIFCQVIVNKGQYPSADLFSPIETPYETNHSVKQIRSIQKGGAFWRARVDFIAQKYDLSPRQCEVLVLLAKGRDIAYMVDHFCISRSTAKTHIYNIYCKLDIHSRQDLLDMIESVDANDLSRANLLGQEDDLRPL